MEQNDSLDRVVAEIQFALNQQAREQYSEQVIRQAVKPQNVGRMAQPDACGMLVGSCGDTMEIYLKIENEHIAQAAFMTDGCGPTIACGSMLTQMITGLTLVEVEKITAKGLLTALDSLPRAHVHCASLAVATLCEAMDEYWADQETDDTSR